MLRFFCKLKARLSTNKMITACFIAILALLQWFVTQITLSSRYACIIFSLALALRVKWLDKICNPTGKNDHLMWKSDQDQHPLLSPKTEQCVQFVEQSKEDRRGPGLPGHKEQGGDTDPISQRPVARQREVRKGCPGEKRQASSLPE